MLAYANYKKPFKLHTDASENGLGAVLYQKQGDGTDHVIAYASQTLSKSKRNYDAHKLDFLALKWSVTERFHEYLCGGHVKVYTDSNPLTYILTTTKLDTSRQRWVASLANFNFKIFYRSGKHECRSRCLIPNTMGIYTSKSYGTFDFKNYVTIKTGNQCRCTRDTSTAECHTEKYGGDSSPKLTHSNQIKEQSEDSDINLIVQLLKSQKLKKYVAKEVDSSRV